ncbi:MAG: VOC family protein [Pseudolabrys sp.]|jgi:2,3-dihydroxybiphenyl 1,2-dioxygenase
MQLQSLGYVGIATDKLEDWSQFATRLLGMQVIERGRTGLALRMDDRKQRLIVDRDSRNGCNFFGWEVQDAAALDRMAAHLESKGVAVTREPQAVADQRCVKALISLHDPMGNRVEIFHGAALADTPFAPGRSISGFRTGPLGVGHVVLTTDNIERVMPFYVDVLGFRLSDYTLAPFKAYFFHINPRHHSFAIVETGKNGIHHLMVELFSFDDVGQGYDLAQGDPERVAVTLGRHTNDLMTSFYTHSPSNFMMEYGWGGQDIDPQTWQPFECDYGPSLWGHDRSWLTPEGRLKARALRMEAAAKGYRAPVQVMEGNYKLMRGVCPWWDAARS